MTSKSKLLLEIPLDFNSASLIHPSDMSWPPHNVIYNFSRLQNNYFCSSGSNSLWPDTVLVPPDIMEHHVPRCTAIQTSVNLDLKLKLLYCSQRGKIAGGARSASHSSWTITWATKVFHSRKHKQTGFTDLTFEQQHWWQDKSLKA